MRAQSRERHRTRMPKDDIAGMREMLIEPKAGVARP